ncbi:MAG TPA: 30S ribosomal protein S8 [Planctomycetes bacterium]|nr:30S ribosomal protein S8 [Planctomycetota bacterium]HIN80076.1 30S ribosomal protein S8 [Planctomycetota bacterium]
MSMTDPIADLLTRIRNINALGRSTVRAPYSTVKEEILKTLEREGYITSFSIEGEVPEKTFKIELKYGPDREKVICRIERVSSPGCRVYSGAKDLPKVRQGLGIFIVSTPKGILSDHEARTQNVGGEILCSVC